MRHLREFVLRLAVLLGIAQYIAASPAVKVSLKTSWPETSLLLEALESVSNEEPNAFFPLLDALTDPEAIPTTVSHTPEAVHQLALQAAISLGFLREPSALASVELQIALHSNSPKIQAAYQFYGDQQLNVDPSCGSWVDWYGTRVCDSETLNALAGHDSIESSENDHVKSSFVHPVLLPIDHINPSPERTLESPPRTAVLYASPSSPNFRELHTLLLRLSSGLHPRLQYVFRHAPPHDLSAKNALLSGYGVSLDLKKMDYLALDDRRLSRQGSTKDDSSSAAVQEVEDFILSSLEAYPQNNTEDASLQLTESELLEIGYKATELITNSSEPMRTLTQLSQNFPKYAKAVARRVVINDTLLQEIGAKQFMVQGGASAAWFNGLTIQETDMTPLGLIRLLRKERSIVQSLTSLGMTSEQAISVLTHPLIFQSQSDTGVLDGLFDASDRSEGGSVIHWWNDITKDSRYAKWNPSLRGLLHQVYPGQWHNVKRNLFNVVLIQDLSLTSSLNFIGGGVSTIIARGFPFRFGVVPMVETEDGLKMAKLFYYLIQTFGRQKTMEFISRISQLHSPRELLTPSVDWDFARIEYNRLNEQYPPEEGDEPVKTFDEAINGEDELINTRIESAKAYATRLDATLASCNTGHGFVNGKHFDLDDQFLRYMQMEFQNQVQYLQEKVYMSELTDADADTIDAYFYDRPQASAVRNRYIYPSEKAGDVVLTNMPQLFAQIGYNPRPGSYLYAAAEYHPLSTIVIADLDSPQGFTLVREAVISLDKDSSSRLFFLHNPVSVELNNQKPNAASTVIMLLQAKELLSRLTPTEFVQLLDLLVEADEDGPDLEQVPLSIDPQARTFLQDKGIDIGVGIDEEASQRYNLATGLILRALLVDPGEEALVVNGRLVGPMEPYSFGAPDVRVLEQYELKKRVTPVIEALYNATVPLKELDRGRYSNIVSSTSSLIAAVQLPDPSERGLFNTNQRPRQRNYRALRSAGNMTILESGNPAEAIYHLAVLLDPVSEIGQKWAPLIEWLSSIPSVHIEIYLNPGTYSELPIKRFYRLNFIPHLSFSEDGSEIPAETRFDDLPVDPIYTLAMDVPPAWLVRPRESHHDLDNIQLSGLSPSEWGKGVQANFSLDYLVIEGHARESPTNQPPRGLQLQLSSLDQSPIDDTQVVANLGYFQFKAKPGVFQLSIREGRGRDVYSMESVGNEGWMSPTVDISGSEVTLASFEGLTLYPRMLRQPGMERADVLDEFTMGEQKQPASLFEDVASRVSSLFSLKKNDSPTEPPAVAKRQADINIFTVASGLLYERFASIMILSVLKNTKSTVKFWFIENFLSPSFLEFIPHFAEAYGFEYELVTYKWPSWLRAQKEKQRIIWAYKILFLDVLFPMDLKKVIFVDADQIVRADLMELVDVDLHGAPYGYVPMGDDNTDMEGFRFWKTGYWKDFLQGLKYHISALYVVDLVRFRQLAAGDLLRGSYQQLSADPNSLANLDQDLPNNLQREVPIFSLPDDWLWCETWCSKDRLDHAKTIDLCQNPLTKEPKLSRARQIPEWEQYDGEIAQFARKLAKEGLIKSDVAAADANVLASTGAGGGGGASNTGAAQSGDAELEEEEQGQESVSEVVEVEEESAVHVKDEL